MRLQQAVMPVQRVLNGPDYLPRKGLSPFMTRREAVARSLGFNALSGIRIERRLGRDESMYHGAITMRKASQKAFNTLRKEELFKKPAYQFERVLMEDVAAEEASERVSKRRRRDDAPFPDENVYADGTDYRMGRGTPLLDLLPVLKPRIRFAPEAAVNRCVRKAHVKYQIIGPFLDAVSRRTPEAAQLSGAMLHEFGAVFTHLELLCRLIVSQEEQRQLVCTSNRRGVLTPSYGKRVYALPGCFRLSRNVTATDLSDYSTAAPTDPGSWGPWKFYESDFGTSESKLRDAMQWRALPSQACSDPTHFTRQNSRRTQAVGIYGGRAASRNTSKQQNWF